MTTQLDPSVRDALTKGGLIDITTTGRKSGQPHRIEIAFHNVGGRIYVERDAGVQAQLYRQPLG